jgi:hypothetical protein
MSDGEGCPTVRIVAIVLGLLILAGTILLVIAGASGGHGSNAMGPLAFLLCIVAVAAMIVLGVTLGGRNNPRRAPHSRATVTQTPATQAPATMKDADDPGDQV